MKRIFRGWWIVAAVFVMFGMTVGMPYYGMPFFYDYFMREFGWTRSQITLGFPLGAVLTLWVGPLLVHRFNPRGMIVVGALCTLVAFAGFGLAGSSLLAYYLLWTLYRGGNVFCGPIPYQVLISEWFRKRRGTAMSVAYLGVGLFGGMSAKFVAQPLTEQYGFRVGLFGIAAVMLLPLPILYFVVRNRPADVGEFPDGIPPAANSQLPAESPLSFQALLRSRAFWLLLVGSACSIGAIGAVNQHLKFVFADRFQVEGISGPEAQRQLNDLFSLTLLLLMWISNLGRLLFGVLADRYPKKWMMVITFFLVAGSIPLLISGDAAGTPYLFAILFGLGLGADYMLIPLVAADQFGLPTLKRAMSIILPADTVGQACFPYLLSELRQYFGSYELPLGIVCAVAALGAVAVVLLPSPARYEPSPHRAEVAAHAK